MQLKKILEISMSSSSIAKTKTPSESDLDTNRTDSSIHKDHIPSSVNPSLSGYLFSPFTPQRFAMLLVASVLASILFSSHFLGLVSAQSVDSYISTEGPIAKTNLLANIGPSGSKSQIGRAHV